MFIFFAKSIPGLISPAGSAIAPQERKCTERPDKGLPEDLFISTSPSDRIHNGNDNRLCRQCLRKPTKQPAGKRCPCRFCHNTGPFTKKKPYRLLPPAGMNAGGNTARSVRTVSSARFRSISAMWISASRFFHPVHCFAGLPLSGRKRTARCPHMAGHPCHMNR